MAGGAVSGSPLEMFLVLPELLVLWMGKGWSWTDDWVKIGSEEFVEKLQAEFWPSENVFYRVKDY
jgi:hypothetical protein|tara:strand:- start:14 stop:208 length:195 start_codon:yes stop_codon:yes gene_type:complete